MATAKEKALEEKQKIEDLVLVASGIITDMKLNAEDYDLNGDAASLEAVIATLNEIGDKEEVTEVEEVVKPPTLAELNANARKAFASMKEKKEEANFKSMEAKIAARKK